ncbi:phage holin family protein [Stenotrophomonas rhizophila]|uniref:phage holin family protein n=1 Tax=Stenotrophomonas rhizophila TaxID=216778 RepID=UPI001E48736E|nr:phage holin family protein [Stenotrophomonas rhizophila]MCC7633034.1 phage holin family protein [Stenotrophomonas rhizophila]MCC7661927.1 phage holin family protein [Stenotrophomonas rhizophila]
MSDPTPSTAAGGAQTPPPDSGEKAPHLDESIRQVGQAGRDTVDAAKHTLRSLRRLASADFALARSAFGRALAWSGVAIVFGASAWLLLAGTLIALMVRWGMSWFHSLLITSILSLVVTGYAMWRVSFFFRHTGMHATRRQLSRLGLYDEPGEEDPDADVDTTGAKR